MASAATTTRVAVGRGGAFVSPPVDPPPEGLYAHTAVGHRLNEVWGFEGVDEEHVRAYCSEGYLVVRDAFSPATVAEALEGVQALAEERPDTPFARAAAAHAERVAGMGLEAALLLGNQGRDGPGIQFEAGGDALPAGRRAHRVRKLKNWHGLEPRLTAVTEAPEFRRVVGRLVSGEAARPAPMRVFQSLALLKPPGGREKPWHMDHAYFDLRVAAAPSGAPTEVVGAWLALDAAEPENGCMFAVPGRLEPALHWQRRDWQMCDSAVAGAPRVALPLAPGSLLLFSSLLPHGTPPNGSSRPRRALQWHFVPEGLGVAPAEARAAVFAARPPGAQC